MPITDEVDELGRPVKRRVTALRDLKVAEISLVNRPANRREFLILKAEGGSMSEQEVLKAVLESKLDDEDAATAVLEKAGLSD